MSIQQYPLPKSGIPSGNTANRPSSPVIGDTYYNGQLEVLEIYNGTVWVANSAPPAVPSIVSVTDVGTVAYSSGGTFTIVVTPGSGGATALQYNAITTAGGFSATSTGTTISMTGLTPNTSFSVEANAQNNFGTTVNSSPFSAVLATTRPQTPTIGTATASGSVNEVTVTWTLGSTGGKTLSAITITPYLNGTTAETSRTAATTSSTSYTFTAGQLTTGANYTFKVKTTNANGDSPESSATNSATMPGFVQVEYLVVAGGASGGLSDPSHYGAGGGGAGGYRTSTGPFNKSTNYAVTVGAGGSAVTTNNTAGNNGSNSVFASITSTGGGGGGGRTASPKAGGSGGGASSAVSGGAGNSGGYSPVEGFAGGASPGLGNFAAGGGGANAAAADYISGSGNTGTAGGAGKASSITGTSVTRGGGGGGVGQDPAGTVTTTDKAGPGGAGGGGKGGNWNAGPDLPGDPGTANTGGGGGGGIGEGSSGYTSSAGGSGVVILRWLTSDASITVGAGLTADATGTDGSYSYKRITAGSGNVSFA